MKPEEKVALETLIITTLQEYWRNRNRGIGAMKINRIIGGGHVPELRAFLNKMCREGKIKRHRLPGTAAYYYLPIEVGGSE